MKKKKLLLLTTTFLVTLCLNAQQNQDSISMYDLQQVEVKATRVSQKMPIAYTNISQQDIEKQNIAQDIPYLIQNTPSLVVTSDAGNGVGYTDIRLRGVDASRINVTTNGVPMNDAESHKMYWVDAPDLASAISTIQIQRGAGSSTNGAGAFGGSINMTTESLQQTFGGEASLSYGMFNTNKQSLKMHSGMINGHWAIDGRVSHIYSDGYIDRASTDLKSFLFQAAYYNGSTMLKYLSFGGKERTYNAWDGISKEQMDENRRYNSCGEIQDVEGKVLGYYDDQIDNYTQWNNQLIFNHKFSNHLVMNVISHYTWGEGYYQQYKNDASLDKYMLPTTETLDHSNLIRRKAMGNDFYGAVASANYTVEKLDVALGIAWNKYAGSHFGRVLEVVSDPDFMLPFEYYRNKSNKTDANIFLKATYEVFPHLNLYGDLQYRQISHEIKGSNSSYDYTAEVMQTIDVDETYRFFNPKFGFNYRFATSNAVYASFSVAQREPTRDDFSNASIDANGCPIFPKSERMLDYEFGYQCQKDSWNVGVNFYYMDYDNQLVLTGQENMDTYDALYENVKDSYREGVEVSIGVKSFSWLNVAGNVTYSQNKIKNYTEYVYNDDTWSMDANKLGLTTISYSPDMVIGLMLMAHYKTFEASLSTSYVSEQYITNSERESMKLDEYNVTNLQLYYTLKTTQTKDVRFGLIINNLFSQKYCSHAFGYSGIYGGMRSDSVAYFPQATTNMLANVTFKF